ncbi:MAG: hypothetical protein KAT58_05095 [candidate division Zixibacteria bacterium]|nr:hypothetical protein [candidate division Zixibacteria bacterium]
MKRYLYLTCALLAVAAFSVPLLAEDKVNQPKDSFGRIDVAEVVVQQLKGSQFSLTLNWANDQELAALTYPLLVTGKNFRMHYDSISWVGRAEYFSVKSSRPIDSMQQVLVGFINDLGEGKPPLADSSGTVATLFFTAEVGKKKVDICDIIVDTVFILPSNVLFAVTPGGKANVHPEYRLVRISTDGKPVKCK